MAVVFKQVRERADGLFRAFLEAWSKDCHPSHEAMLFLELPVIPKNRRASVKESTYKFRLALRGKPSAVEGSWLETNVTVSEDANNNTGSISSWYALLV